MDPFYGVGDCALRSRATAGGAVVNAMGFGGGGPGSNLGGELLCRGVPQLSKFELHTDAVATSKLSY